MSDFGKKYFIKTAFLFIVLGLLFSTCKQINIFEKNTLIPNLKWQSNFTAAGSFDIGDTSTTYNIYIVLRHTDAYLYNNIWLNVGLQQPGDSMQFQKINLVLASDAFGWDGIGMNDIWDVRKLISGLPKRFKKLGTYKFSIAQIMRDEPLEHVMSAGIRIQKTE